MSITVAEIPAYMKAARRSFRRGLPPIEPAKKMRDIKVSTIWSNDMQSDLRGEHLNVVLSDNIGIRCGCRTKRKKNAALCLYVVSIKKAEPTEAVVECTACKAIWLWGEVCAARPDNA